MASHYTSVKDVLAASLSNLNQADKLDFYIEYFRSEWILSVLDLKRAVADSTVWSGLSIPAMLKVEIKSILTLILDHESIISGMSGLQTTIKSSCSMPPVDASSVSTNDEGITDNHERKKVIVRVPATSANLGPGFDAIGMAVDMWSEFTVERSDVFEIVCEGEGSHDIPLDETNLVCYAVAAAFKRAGKPVPILKYYLKNRIPYARGLGSSSAAIVGGLIAGFVLAGHQVTVLDNEDMLNMAADIGK
jgi:hypothetical protein